MRRQVDFSKYKEELGKPDFFNTPFIIKAADETKAWRQKPKVNLAFAEYGGLYKKSAPFKQHGKSQQAMTPREDTDAFVMQLLPPSHTLDITAVPGGSSFSSAVWLFGFAPEMISGGTILHGAGMLRVIVQGSLHVRLFSSASFCKHVGKMSSGDAEQKMLTATSDELKGMAAKFEIYQATIEQDDVLWYPTAWLAFERTTDVPLIYGMRKSAFMKHPDIKGEVAATMKMMEAAGKDTAKLSAVHELF